jgi:hypothetical protein
MARNFPVKIKEKYPSVSCVYKVHFGHKFLIVKAKYFKQSIDSFTEDIDRKIRLGLKENDQYEKVVKYIKTGRITFCTAEVLFQSDNHGALMAFENKILSENENNKQCLNKVFVAYQPKWMSQKQIDDFNNSPGDQIKTETTPVIVKKPESNRAAISKQTVVKATEIDLKDISDILQGLDEINAAKDLKISPKG